MKSTELCLSHEDVIRAILFWIEERGIARLEGAAEECVEMYVDEETPWSARIWARIKLST